MIPEEEIARVNATSRALLEDLARDIARARPPRETWGPSPAALVGSILAVGGAWAMDYLGAVVLFGLILVYLGSRGDR